MLAPITTACSPIRLSVLMAVRIGRRNGELPDELLPSFCSLAVHDGVHVVEVSGRGSLAQRVRAGAAVERVIVVAAPQRGVVAAAAGERVVAVAGVEVVGAAASGERV